MFRVPVFYPRMTAEKILRYSARLHHVPGEEIDQLTRELMECLERPRIPARESSASEQKRLAVGSALIYSPQVLLVDELRRISLGRAAVRAGSAQRGAQQGNHHRLHHGRPKPASSAAGCAGCAREDCTPRLRRKACQPRFKLLYLDREPIEAVYGIPDLFFVESDGASSVFLYHGEARLRGQLGALRQEAYRIHSMTREELSIF